MAYYDSTQEIQSIDNESFEKPWDLDDINDDFFASIFDQVKENHDISADEPHTCIINKPLNVEPFLEIKDESDLVKFLRSHDNQKRMEARLCMCQSILRCYVLSLSTLLPSIKLSLKSIDYEKQVINRMCQHERFMGPSEPHAFFCQSDRFYECVRDIVDIKSVLNIINLSVMTTNYCSRCRYQKQSYTEGPFIIPEPCDYVSDTIVKQEWICPTCETSINSLIEHKINPSKTMTAYMIFTLSGIKSNEKFVYKQNPRDIHMTLNGWFEVRYVVVDTEGIYRIYEHKNNMWSSYCSLQNRSFSWKTIPFRSQDIRVIVFHHTKPCIVAKSLLTVKNIKEYAAARKAHHQTSDSSSPLVNKLQENKVQLPAL